jgi:hypothetical protein
VCVVAVANEVVLRVHLTVCSDLSSDYLQILNDVACRAAFQNYMSRPDFTRTDWTGPPQDCSVANPVVINMEVVDKPVEDLDGAVL